MERRRRFGWRAALCVTTSAVVALGWLGGCASRDTRSGPALNDAEGMAWRDTLRQSLEADVRTLAEEYPSRSILQPDRLEASARWLAQRLASMGYDVRNEPYEMPGPESGTITVRNLYVEVPASGENDGWLIIGAHYDTVEDSPGADDNASGVAGVLALAEYFRTRPQPIGLRFELYTNEELIRHSRSHMGSLRRAEAAVAAGDRLLGAIVFEMIGYYSEGPVSPAARQFAREAGIRLPANDVFLAVASWESARVLAEPIVNAWRGPVGVVQVLTPVGEPMAARSDHSSYLRMGVPAVMLTDTAEFRNPYYHTPGDTPGTLNFARMTEAVDTIRSVIESLAADPSFTAAPAAMQELQRLTIENTGATRANVRIPALGRGVLVEPGATATIDAPINGTVLLVGLAAVSFTPDSLDVAGESSRMVQFRLLGRPGGAMVTQQSTYFFEREGVEGFEIDGVIVRLAAQP